MPSPPQPVFTPPQIPELPVAYGSTVFPVGRVFCVGRNYAAHAAEMGGEVARDAPWYFTKSMTAVISGPTAPFPPGTSNYHHEVELVAALHSGGSLIPEADAMDCVFGYAVGLDMTRRDLQATAKSERRPWDTAKDVEASAIIGPILPSTEYILADQVISLTVNGEERQRASLGEMVWSLPEIIAHLSSLYTLRAGDIIMTGTPAGVGSIEPGDTLRAEVEGLPTLNVTIGKRQDSFREAIPKDALER